MDHDSGVVAYESGSDFIRVLFRNGAQYLYNTASVGIRNIEEMKKRAVNGIGLSTYISQHVKDRYHQREK